MIIVLPPEHAACWLPVHRDSANYSFRVHPLPYLSIVSLLFCYKGSTNKEGVGFFLEAGDVIGMTEAGCTRSSLTSPYDLPTHTLCDSVMSVMPPRTTTACISYRVLLGRTVQTTRAIFTKMFVFSSRIETR